MNDRPLDLGLKQAYMDRLTESVWETDVLTPALARRKERKSRK